jgi:hypothetical protein
MSQEGKKMFDALVERNRREREADERQRRSPFNNPTVERIILAAGRQQQCCTDSGNDDINRNRPRDRAQRKPRL